MNLLSFQSTLFLSLQCIDFVNEYGTVIPDLVAELLAPLKVCQVSCNNLSKLEKAWNRVPRVGVYYILRRTMALQTF